MRKCFISAGIPISSQHSNALALGHCRSSRIQRQSHLLSWLLSALITLTANQMVRQTATIWMVTLYDRLCMIDMLETALDFKETVIWVQELQAIVSRAALQSPESAQQLPEEVFWFATQPKDRLKWNLLSPGAFPWLKPFLRRFDSIPWEITIIYRGRRISTNSYCLLQILKH